MSNLKSQLWDLYDHMIQVPAVIRTIPNAIDHHRRHADELAGAAAMWSEQNCGTCHYYWRPTVERGYCLWANLRPLPSCMENEDFAMAPEGGSECPVWQAKQTANAD